MMFGISIKSYNLMMDTLAKYPVIEKTVIFGSRAIGNYKHGSDIDLAIFGKDVTIETVDEISIELNEKLPIPYYFDIVHYEGLSHEGLRNHIDTYGKLLVPRSSEV